MKFLKEEGYKPTNKVLIFDQKQIIALLFCLISSLILIAVMFFQTESVNLMIFRICATGNLLLISFRSMNYLLIQRNFTAEFSLPLHLCSYNVILCFIAAWTLNVYIMDFIFAMSPFAALAALLFPDSEAGKYPHFNFRSIEYYTAHSLLVITPMMPIMFLGFQPDMKYMSVSVYIFLFMLMVAGIADYYTNGNYMFLNFAPKNTPLKYVEDKFGRGIYRLTLIFSFVMLYLIMHIAVYFLL